MIGLKEKTISVKCPKCEKEFDATIYTNINATTENGLAKRLRDGSLFLQYCPHCSQKINMEYSFIYHQVEDHLLVHYCVSDEDLERAQKSLTQPSDEEKQMVNALMANDTMIRLVRSKAQLLEKVCIYDAGMDDRVIEIMKHMVAGSFLRDNPDKKISNICFNVYTQSGQEIEVGKKFLEIYCDNNKVAQAEVTEELYRMVFDEFISAMPPLRADHNIMVTPGWAKGVIDLKNAKTNLAD